MIYSDLDILDKYIIDKNNLDLYEYKQRLYNLTKDVEIKKFINDKLNLKNKTKENLDFITIDIFENYLNKAYEDCKLTFIKLQKNHKLFLN